MFHKTGFIILTVGVVLFAPGRIERLIAHSQPLGSVAWAQDATDAEQGADVSSQPDAAAPSVAGTWEGPINDNSFGSADFTIVVKQKQSKLKGNWTISIGGGGTFVGKVKSDGTTLLFRFKERGKRCHVKATATLLSPTEMTGTYTAKSCSHASTGNFDLNHQ